MAASLLDLWPILVFFALGYATKIAGLAPAQLPHRLNLLTIRVIFPAVILLTIPHLKFDHGVFFVVLAPWLCIGISASVVLLLARYLRWPRPIIGALLILTSLGNTGFLGVPMIKTLFGLEQVALAIMYDQLGTFVAVVTYATILVTLFSGEGEIRIPAILKKILLFPPFVTLVIALLLPPTALTPLNSLLEVMAAAVIPLTMLSIGIQFNFRVSQTDMAPLVIGLSIKMILLPLLIALLAIGLSVSPAVLETSVFQSATPPMVTGAILLTAHNIAPKFTASMLGFGTLFAFLWLPFVYFLLKVVVTV